MFIRKPSIFPHNLCFGTGEVTKIPKCKALILGKIYLQCVKRQNHDDVIKWKHFRVTGHLRPMTRSFDIFFDLRPNKRLSKHWWSWIWDAIASTMTHMPWCMLGSLTSSFLWSRWRGKRSRNSWRMRNPQFDVSGKRPITKETEHQSCFKQEVYSHVLFYNLPLGFTVISDDYMSFI